jgi:hypothetical protein
MRMKLITAATVAFVVEVTALAASEVTGLQWATAVSAAGSQ